MDAFLREFVAEAEELDRRRLPATFRPSFTGSYLGGLSTDESPKADADDLIAFVTNLRVFWMTSERFYLPKVYDAALAAPGALREPIEESRKWWDVLEGPGSIQLGYRTPDGKQRILTNRQLADKWINGIILHRRRKDREFIEGLDTFGQGLARFTFLDYLYGYAGEVMALALAVEGTPLPSPRGPAGGI